MILPVYACRYAQQLHLFMVIYKHIDALCRALGNFISLLIIHLEDVCHIAHQEYIHQLILLICMLIIQHGHVSHYVHNHKICIILSTLQILQSVNVY
jgi:hypothetical protein